MVDSARKNYSKQTSKTKQHSTNNKQKNSQKTHQNEMIPNRQKCSDILYSHFLHQKKKFLLPKREAKIKIKQIQCLCVFITYHHHYGKDTPKRIPFSFSFEKSHSFSPLNDTCVCFK